MSLSQLNKKELLKLAAKADVQLDGSEVNKEIVEKLKASNVSYDYYKKVILDARDEEQEDEPLFDKNTVLLKMERKNPSLEAFGHRFTREHPYALVDEDTAQQIIDSYEGFRLASPAEARAFYS